MKYITSYDSIAAYNTAKANGELVKPNLSLVGGKTYSRPLWNCGFGDVVMYNSKTGDFDYCTSDAFKESYFHMHHLTPIGVVVCPGRYTPDNTTRVMSLVNMDATSPATGSASKGGVAGETSMIWGSNTSTSVTGKTFPKVANVTPSTGEALTEGGTDWMRIPSDQLFRSEGYAYNNNGLKYYYYYGATEETDGSGRFGPYPILANGDKNPLYFNSAYATSDFDGIGNTDKICNNGFSGWSTATLDGDDTSTANNFPPAFCCRRFATTGTSAGDWYLPACGELAFVVAFYTEIDKGLDAVRTARGTSVATYVGKVGGREVGTYGVWMWSSSEGSVSDARYVYTDDGYVDYYSKTYVYTDNRVRAFIAL